MLYPDKIHGYHVCMRVHLSTHRLNVCACVRLSVCVRVCNVMFGVRKVNIIFQGYLTPLGLSLQSVGTYKEALVGKVNVKLILLFILT